VLSSHSRFFQNHLFLFSHAKRLSSIQRLGMSFVALRTPRSSGSITANFSQLMPLAYFSLHLPIVD
jgi:hypothetical protein